MTAAPTEISNLTLISLAQRKDAKCQENFVTGGISERNPNGKPDLDLCLP
jgi:hypothetical protein